VGVSRRQGIVFSTYERILQKMFVVVHPDLTSFGWKKDEDYVRKVGYRWA